MTPLAPLAKSTNCDDDDDDDDGDDDDDDEDEDEDTIGTISKINQPFTRLGIANRNKAT